MTFQQQTNEPAEPDEPEPDEPEPDESGYDEACGGESGDGVVIPMKLIEMFRREDEEGPATGSGARSDRPTPAPEQPAASTVQTRRRLANSLLWTSVLFAGSWLPYVVNCFCQEFLQYSPPLLVHYSYMAGQSHSAIRPILYRLLNHRSLQPPCNFREPDVIYSVPSSSTDEAELGPFHPRFIKPKTPRSPVRRHSSLYLP